MRIIYWQCQTPIVAKKILAFSQCQIFQSTQRSHDSRKEEKVNLPDGFLQRVPSLGSRPASQFILPPSSHSSLNHPGADHRNQPYIFPAYALESGRLCFRYLWGVLIRTPRHPAGRGVATVRGPDEDGRGGAVRRDGAGREGIIGIRVPR